MKASLRLAKAISSCCALASLIVALVLYGIVRIKPINCIWPGESVCWSFIVADSRACLTRFWVPVKQNKHGRNQRWKVDYVAFQAYGYAIYDDTGVLRDAGMISMLLNQIQSGGRVTWRGWHTNLEIRDRGFVVPWPYGRIGFETGNVSPNPADQWGQLGVAQVMFHPLQLAAVSLLFFLSLNPAIVLRPYRAWRSHRRPQDCRSCRYDLRGSVASLRCPECGRVLDEQDRTTLATLRPVTSELR